MGTRVGTNAHSTQEAHTGRYSLPKAIPMIVGMLRGPRWVGRAVCRRVQGGVADLRASRHRAGGVAHGRVTGFRRL